MMITWTNEKRKLSELIPWEINPAQIGTDEARRLEESLDEFGQIQTIAISPTNEIYDGHQRKAVWGASKKFGTDYEVDVRVSSRELTERERKKLVIYLRKGTVGSFDFDLLANNWELDDLLEWGFDKKELDLDLWAGEMADDPGAQMDKAEELREKWGVETGQLWQLGEHRLICGDCTDRAVVERVMGNDKANLVFADPPYGIGYEYRDYDDNTTNEKYIEFCQNWFGVVSLFGDLLFITPGWKFEYWWITKEPYDRMVWFDKSKQSGGRAYYLRKSEPIYIFGKVKNKFDWDVIDSLGDRDSLREYHTCPKPKDLLEKIIEKQTVIGDTVLDPFVGSGTCVVACERLGRKCRAVEISPAYCAVAIQRWVDMTKGEPLLLAEINRNEQPESV